VAGLQRVGGRRVRLAVDENTLYSLASVTKTFTATMVLRLYEEGKVGLDDPIREYVPPYMPSTEEVTVRELLDDERVLRCRGRPDHHRLAEQPQLSLDARRYPHPGQAGDVKPGKRYNYCNTNFVILGGIIDHVSPLGVGASSRISSSVLSAWMEMRFIDRVASRRRALPTDTTSKTANPWTFLRSASAGCADQRVGPVWTDGGVVATANRRGANLPTRSTAAESFNRQRWLP